MQIAPAVGRGRFQCTDHPHIQPKRWSKLPVWSPPPFVRERHNRNPRAVIHSNGGIAKPHNHALASTRGSREHDVKD